MICYLRSVNDIIPGSSGLDGTKMQRFSDLSIIEQNVLKWHDIKCLKIVSSFSYFLLPPKLSIKGRLIMSMHFYKFVKLEFKCFFVCLN